MNAPERSRPVSPAASLRGADGWQRASLRFAVASDGRTRLARQFVQYPFHITRPVHLDAGWPELATLVMQSTSGGLYRDDRVALEISVGAGAAAHVTTQSATKVHSMEDGGVATQNTSLTVEADGYAEFLSDALILFSDSRIQSDLSVSVAAGGAAVISDAALWHDPAPPAAPEMSVPDFALFSQALRIRDEDGVVHVCERQLSGRESLAGLAPWQAHGVQASLYAIAPGRPLEPIVEALRAALGKSEEVWGGVTALPGGVGAAVRILANDGAAMREVTGRLWRASRMALVGRPDGLNWRK